MGKKTATAIVTCPYCGVQQTINVPEGTTEEQLEEYAVKVCSCDEAKQERRRLSVNDKVDMLFGAGSEANGFDEPLEADELKSLKQLCADVLGSIYINATVTLPSGNKARITTVKDQIKMVRESKNHAETKI